MRIIQHGRKHLIQQELTPDEADEVAYALGNRDEAAKELHRLADLARRYDEEEER